jgi:predicted nucleic acid-binding protein
VAVFVDTNVLIFSIQHGHPWREASIAAIERVLAADERAYVLPQNIAEFWNVCTRPADKNGLGLSPMETEERLKGLDPILSMLHDSPEVYARWRQLLVQHSIRGVQVHDARIAAAMQVQGIGTLLTFNPRDFGRYEGIATILPSEK